MFFSKRKTGELGSRCPVTASTKSLCGLSAMISPKSQSVSNMKIPTQDKNGIILLRPRLPINTYKMHQTLFDIASEEIISSTVLEYFI